MAGGRFRVARSVAILGGALLFYYSVPLPDESVTGLALAMFLVGLVVLIVLIVQQVRHHLQAPDNETVRLYSLLAVLYVVITFFALTYVWLERASPGEFAELDTRTDALYFTVVTLGTVGYGDVHPVGQAARLIATTQIAFDLVFVAALLSVFSSRVTRVVAARSATEGD